MKSIKRKYPASVQPYTFEYHGKYINEPINFHLFIYDEEDFFEVLTNDFNVITTNLNKTDSKKMIWLNIYGLHKPEVFRNIGKEFNIPNSLLHEVLSSARRSKIEENDSAICCNMKSVNPILNNGKLDVIPVSLILKDNVLLSFQEKHNNFFDVIRERIRTRVGNVRRKKEDFLMYLMIDAMLENFYNLLDRFEEILELVLLEVNHSKTPASLKNIQNLKTNYLDLKRVIIPLKEVIGSITNSTISPEYPFLEDVNTVYFSKIHNKILEISDQIDDDLIQIENATNYFFSMQTHRMNEIMKVLTIVSVLFIPLTFVVGVYGMNFEYIPELKFVNGYFYVWGFMILLVISMLIYFKWKKWF